MTAKKFTKKRDAKLLFWLLNLLLLWRFRCRRRRRILWSLITLWALTLGNWSVYFGLPFDKWCMRFYAPKENSTRNFRLIIAQNPFIYWDMAAYTRICYQLCSRKTIGTQISFWNTPNEKTGLPSQTFCFSRNDQGGRLPLAFWPGNILFVKGK